MTSNPLVVTLIDHQDSFSRTVAAEIEALGAQVLWITVPQGAQTLPSELWSALRSSHGVVLSPGPGHPRDYPHEDLRRWLAEHPECHVLGVCLGLQILLSWTGLTIGPIGARPVHGRREPIGPENERLPAPFSSLAPGAPAVFYNSLGARWDEFLAHGVDSWEAVPSASAERHVHVNVACHRALPWYGVQFHPESFATPVGSGFFGAFVDACTTSHTEHNPLERP